MTKHIRHKPEILFFAYRTDRFGFCSNIPRSTDEFRVRIAHLIAPQPADANLIDQHPAGQAMVNDSSAIG
jgi:hypothetical protein